MWLFLRAPLVGLQCVIVAFLGHIHLHPCDIIQLMYSVEVYTGFVNPRTSLSRVD